MQIPTKYHYTIEPQSVDFTLRATIDALGSFILNTAGTDAHNKGFGTDVLAQKNRTWVLSRFAFELDFRPEQYTDIEVDTWIGDNNRLISTRNFILTDAEGKSFCRAVSQWCMLDFERRVPVSITEFAESCREFVRPDIPSPCDLPHKLGAITPSLSINHKVVYSDIDFNYHMNTMRYLVLMIDMLPIDIMKENRAVRVDMNFMHECRLGQVLTIGCEQRDNLFLFEVSNEEGVACRASFEWR